MPALEWKCEAITISDRFAATSSIKEEEGDLSDRPRLSPSSSLMEEVAAKRSEMVRVTRATRPDPQPSSSSMEEVAAKRSEMVRMTGATRPDRQPSSSLMEEVAATRSEMVRMTRATPVSSRVPG